MIEELRTAGPVVVVDGGGSLYPRRMDDPAQDAQRRAKAAAILDAWAAVGIDAVAFSADDWRLGRDEVTRRAAAGLPVLAANLVCGDARPFPASRVVERGGWKVGFVGVTAGTLDGCTTEDPLVAAKAALEGLGDVDVRVLLAPVSSPDQRRMSDATLPVDLVVDPSGRTDEIPPAWGGGLALAAGSRGKMVGVATLVDGGGPGPWLAEGVLERLEADRVRLAERRTSALERAKVAADAAARARLEKQAASYDGQLAEKDAEILAVRSASGSTARRFSLAIRELDAKIADHPPTAAIVAAALASLGPVAPTTTPRRGPAGSAFAGAEACASCHVQQNAQWGQTPHAGAWASLVTDGHAADADCTACHATGVGQPGGPSGPTDVAGLRDVQCEACHGPSAAHVADPGVLPVRDPPVDTCRACHDGQRDGGRFDPTAYHAKVIHRSVTSLQR